MLMKTKFFQCDMFKAVVAVSALFSPLDVNISQDLGLQATSRIKKNAGCSLGLLQLQHVGKIKPLRIPIPPHPFFDEATAILHCNA